jgi:hypothetical protein
MNLHSLNRVANFALLFWLMKMAAITLDYAKHRNHQLLQAINKCLTLPFLLLIAAALLNNASFGQSNSPAQTTESTSNAFNKKASTKVYVLSNRETSFQNNTYAALNKVKKSTSLDFITATSIDDSLQITKVDSVDFLSEISGLADNWLVFVHGDAKTLEQSIIRGFDMQQLYNINVLVFSWPSKDNEIYGARNFKKSQGHVAESLNHFVQVLQFTCI